MTLTHPYPRGVLGVDEEPEKDETLEGLGYSTEEKIEGGVREDVTKGVARGRPRAEPG